MWMRVDNKFDDVLQFDNMNNRPITGTTNWNRYEIILDVPLQSAAGLYYQDVAKFGLIS